MEFAISQGVLSNIKRARDSLDKVSALLKEIKFNKTQGLQWKINKKYAGLILHAFAKIVVLNILKDKLRINKKMVGTINQEDSKLLKRGLSPKIVLETINQVQEELKTTFA